MIKKLDPNLVNLGDLVEINVGIKDKSGNVKKIEQMSKPLAITLQLPKTIKDTSNAAVYNVIPEYNAAGEITSVKVLYAGGDGLKTGVRFNTDHFSYYIVMERTQTFKDIANNWAKQPIEFLAGRKIVVGYNSNFYPTNKVKRVDFPIMLANVLGKKPEKYKATFEDVKPEDYYGGHILALNRFKILDVQPKENQTSKYKVFDDTNNNYANLSREQAATFMVNAYKYLKTYIKELPEENTVSINYIDFDKVSSDEMKETIKMAARIGIMKGYPDGTFRPQDTLTRAESAQLMVILIKYMSSKT